ncbi:MAG: hypothetical protein EA358_01190 [Flavobacteriales bacterium]|nr:MAG: hypothetical protein EA358_01190 [Flavobacteriales bacterium]
MGFRVNIPKESRSHKSPTDPMCPRPRLERKARRLKRQLVPADKSDGRSSLSAVAPTAVLAEDLQRKARLGAQKTYIKIQAVLSPNAIKYSMSTY